MQTRIKQILEKEGVTAARFADNIGVQRSSISHLVSGRNNPSLEFIQKVLNFYNNINPDWLILGEGTMYRRKNTPEKQA